MQAIIIHKNRLLVSIAWLKQYYAHPSASAKGGGWKQPIKGYYDYDGIYEGSLRSKKAQKSLPSPDELRALVLVKEKKAVVSKIGNKNAEKLQEWHKKILNSLYADPNAYSVDYIYKLYVTIVEKTIQQYVDSNSIDSENNVLLPIVDNNTGELLFKMGDFVNPPLSLRSIQRYLNQPKVKALFDGRRLGNKYHYATYVPTNKPQFINSLWSMDGYTNNFYLSNTFKTCVTYVVIDVATDAILACVTGAAGEKENHQLQLRAWKEAIEAANCFPREVEADGLNVIDYIRDAGIELAHSNRKKAHGSYIEQFFGRTQERYFVNKSGYRGNNITSRKDRLNKDIKPDNPSQYPNIKVEEIREMWYKLKADSQINKNGKESSGLPIEWHKFAYLFGKKYSKTIKNAFIKIANKLFEVSEKQLLCDDMPASFEVDVYHVESHNKAYMFNQSKYIGCIEESVRVQRSRHENNEPENLGHHVSRQDKLERELSKEADRLTDLPDDIQTLVDLARSPSYWSKEKERAIDEAISTAQYSKKPKKGMFDVEEDDFKIEKLA